MGRRLLLAVAEASFLLSQVIAAVGWVLDVAFRYVSCSLISLSIHLKGKAGA